MFILLYARFASWHDTILRLGNLLLKKIKKRERKGCRITLHLFIACVCVSGWFIFQDGV